MKSFFTFVMLLIAQSAFSQLCTQDNRFTEVEYFSTNEIDTLLNIPYGSAVNHVGGTDTLLVDAFFPNNSLDTLSARPAVVMIHGGGYSGGQKEDRWGECSELAKRGFVTFSISYRLGWDQSDSTAQLKAMYRAHQDAHAAIRYIVNNASTFRIDTSWIFVGGTSAGANTANNLIYTDQSDYEAIFPTISTLVGDLYSSTNSLTNDFTLKGIFNNWGSVFIDDIQVDQLLPQIAFHGEADTVVMVDTASNGVRMGSRAIHNYLIAENICSDITVKPGGGHGVYVDANGTTFRSARASCFFKSLFCNTCTNSDATTIVLPSCSTISSQEEYDVDKDWIAFPNPFSHSLNISNLAGDEHLYLYDLNGQLLFSNLQITSENMSQLSSGVYILMIENSKKTKHLKLIKE